MNELSKFTVFGLLDELTNRSQEEIQYALLYLLIKKKVKYIDLSNAYVKSLELENEDQLNKLIEAETCVLSAFHYKMGGKKADDNKATQRALYLLNKSNRFNLNKFNEKYNYDEQLGKEMSWYERNKENGTWN